MESWSFCLTFQWKCLFPRNHHLWDDVSIQQLNEESTEGERIKSGVDKQLSIGKKNFCWRTNNEAEGLVDGKIIIINSTSNSNNNPAVLVLCLLINSNFRAADSFENVFLCLCFGFWYVCWCCLGVILF